MRVAVLLVAAAAVAHACTNYLVTRGASTSNSTMFSYAADSGNLYGSLGHYPAAKHSKGAEREIYDWDSAKFLGVIPEASETYNVVGNMNEYGLAIGETTFGGLPSLATQPGAIMDYGSLIWVTLQRAKTAREAIFMFGNLTAQYGYASDGESFSIGDGNELWVLEMIGKGPGEKGAVWVAVRIPDGYVSGHANQARIRTFPLNDPENCIYAEDVVSFAVRKGLYSGKPEDFSFSDVYCPVSPTSARFCETRVWAFFRQINDDMDQYLDYVQGYNVTNRMPLYVKPNRAISVNDTMWFMRTHFENTWFDNRGYDRPDVGAGAFSSPYRWRPLVWNSNNKSYLNERTVGVQQTAWNFVAQLRGYLPREIGPVLWFAVDDTAHSAHFPVYASSTRISPNWGDQQGQEPDAAVNYAVPGNALSFNFDAAWWIFNLVANYAYARYEPVNDMVAAAIVREEGLGFELVHETDGRALEILKSQGSEAAVEFVTSISVNAGTALVQTWQQLFFQLFVRFRDGFVNTPTSTPVCTRRRQFNCTFRAVPNSAETGYPSPWYGRIVAESGSHYAIPTTVDRAPKLAKKGI